MGCFESKQTERRLRGMADEFSPVLAVTVLYAERHIPLPWLILKTSNRAREDSPAPPTGPAQRRQVCGGRVIPPAPILLSLRRMGKSLVVGPGWNRLLAQTG